MEHLHGPAGAECVTIALEQIESVRLAARTRRIRRLTGNPAQEETSYRVQITSSHDKTLLVYLICRFGQVRAISGPFKAYFYSLQVNNFELGYNHY